MRRFQCLGLVFLAVFSLSLSAQELGSLEDLLDVNTTIASNTSRKLREQPGIVSIITAEEIARSGARDLIDILRLVPGFDFAHDVLGHNSWAFRGQWAMEGKIALIVDGRVYNDPAWGNVVFGNRFPVDLIEKIEIIRGPGSAKYGGYAELAVVNITTKGYGTKGFFTSGALSQMERGFGRMQMNALTGNQSNDMRYSAAVYAATGNQSDQVYSDKGGRLWDMADDSNFRLEGANINYGIGGLDVRFIMDNYSYESENLYGGTFGDMARFISEHQSKYLGLEYVYKVAEHFTLTPKASYLEEVQHKISIDEIDAGAGYPTVLGIHYFIPTTRMTTSLNGLYEFNKHMNVIFGYEYLSTFAESKYFNADWNGTPAGTYLRGSNRIHYLQNSAYAQGELYTPIVNLTAGGRWTEHSGASDSVFVPRLAMTKVFDALGFKLMYSQAFRMGDVEHINLSRDAATSTIPVELKPERTTVTEFEVSFAQSPKNIFSLNVYDIKISDAITYAANNTTRNLGELKSRGAEFEWKLLGSWGSNRLNASHYAGEGDAVPAYRANADDRAYLGLPRTKLAWIGSFNLFSQFSFDPSAVHFTKKYGRDKATGVETEFDSTTLVDLFVTYKAVSGLSASLGVHDLLRQHYKFVQAYDNGIPAQPGPSREVMAKVAYNHQF